LLYFIAHLKATKAEKRTARKSQNRVSSSK